jgi:hypothetical protein
LLSLHRELQRLRSSSRLRLALLELNLLPDSGSQQEGKTPTQSQVTRARPSAEEQEPWEQVGNALSEFLNRELSSPDERIGALPGVLRRFLEQQSRAIQSIRGILVAPNDVSWDLDVTQGVFGPVPNFLGQLRLQRVLIASALHEARRGEADEALQTLEASWRLNQSLASRPELISQINALTVARLQAGTLRKIDALSPGWPQRLRSRDLLSGNVAALENEVWLVAQNPEDLSDEISRSGRVFRKVAGGLDYDDLCRWTSPFLTNLVLSTWEEEAGSAEVLAGFTKANILAGLSRWPRFLLESELTALVLDARAERAASRLHAWPKKLLNVESSVCPPQQWSYRAANNGTMTIRFEGKLPEFEAGGLRLPLAFTAGIPVPVKVPVKPTPGHKTVQPQP